MKKSNFIFFAVLLIQIIASAGASESHDEHAIPFQKIVFQFINLGILLVAIYFAVNKTIVAAFAARKNNYTEQAQKTAQANAKADLELAEIKTKISDLKTNENQIFSKAKNEAMALKEKIVQEAQSQAIKLKTESEQVIQAEIFKAKASIREELINTSTLLAVENIKKQALAVTQKSEDLFIADIIKNKAQVNQ